jgi:hypothetical protein
MKGSQMGEPEIQERSMENEQEAKQRPSGSADEGNASGTPPLGRWEGYSLATLNTFFENY